MSSLAGSRALTSIIRRASRFKPTASVVCSRRKASSKHPNGFVPPTPEDLTDLRERVQAFIRKSTSNCMVGITLTADTGREIPEEVAAKTDRDNEFPMEIWKKFGEAG